MSLKRKAKVLVLTIVSVCVLCACGKSGGTTTNKSERNLPSSLDKVYCTLKNANYVFYEDLTSGRMVTFNLISPDKLEKDNLKINIDTDIKYTYDMEEVKDDEFLYNVFQAYNGVDWKKMKNLYLAGDTEKYMDYYNSLNEEYRELDKKSLPDIYSYKVTINFQLSEDMEDDEVNQIQISCNGKAQTYEVGSIKLKKKSNININGKGITMNTVAVGDYPLLPNSEGKLPFDNAFTFTADKNITLKNIENVLDDGAIEDISVDVQKGDTSINQKWDGNSSFSIKKGSQVTIYGNIVDNKFKNNDLYSTIKYIRIVYELDGKTYSEKMEYSYGTRLDKYEYAAMLHDNIDMASYYKEYYNYVNSNTK